MHEDGRFELVEIAAEQLAVLEEYYAVPGAPRPAPAGDRLAYVVEPDPARPAVFDGAEHRRHRSGRAHPLGARPSGGTRLATRRQRRPDRATGHRGDRMKLPGLGRSSTEDDPQKDAHAQQHHVAHGAGHRPGGIVDVATLDTSPKAAKLRDTEDIDEEALLAEFEAEKPARKLSGHPRLRRPGRRRRAVAVLALLGVQPDGEAGLPADVPERRPVPDLPDLPRLGPLGQGQAVGQAPTTRTSWTGRWPCCRWSRRPTSSRTGRPSSGGRSRPPTWTSSSGPCWCCWSSRRLAARSASWYRWSSSGSSPWRTSGPPCPVRSRPRTSSGRA